MTLDLRELIALYALDMLDPDEVAQVTAALATDPRLEAELVALRDAAHALAAMAAVTPQPDVETQLVASIGGGRFDTFAARVAAIFDVTIERARELLALIERANAWELPLPGIALIHFAGGQACATADCGFVRISGDGTFPWHTHRGDELSLIIAGTLRDADGKLFRPGDELLHAAGTSHELKTDGDQPVIFVARAFNGIELGARPGA